MSVQFLTVTDTVSVLFGCVHFSSLADHYYLQYHNVSNMDSGGMHQSHIHLILSVWIQEVQVPQLKK